MKIFLFLSLLVSVTFNIYFYKNLTPNQSYSVLGFEDNIKLSQSGLNKAEMPKISNLTSPKSIFQVNPAELSKEVKQLKNEEMLNDLQDELVDDIKKIEDQARKINKKYHSDLESFLFNDLSLNETEIQNFYELNELKKTKLNEHWESLHKTESGEKKIFFPTAGEQIEMAKIEEQHMIQLKELLGEGGYNKYEKYVKIYIETLLEKNQNIILPQM